MNLERAAALVAVVALHLVLYLLLVNATSHAPEESHPPGLVLVLPITSTPVAPQQSSAAQPPSRAGKGPEKPSGRRAVAPVEPRSSAGTQAGPPIPSTPASPAPTAPDWAREAEVEGALSARAQMDSERRASALSSRYTIISPYVPHSRRAPCFAALFRVLPKAICGPNDAPPDPVEPADSYFKRLWEEPPSLAVP